MRKMLATLILSPDPLIPKVDATYILKAQHDISFVKLHCVDMKPENATY